MSGPALPYQAPFACPNWIIQTNMGSGRDMAALAAAVRRSGAVVEEVQIIPFSGQLPDIGSHGPVIVYGAVGFVTDAHAAGRWVPGVFADPDVFTYANWVSHYGDLLLNSADATEVTTIGSFIQSVRSDSDDVFVRPSDDSKAIGGAVWNVGTLRDWCRRASKGEWAGITADTGIIIGRPYGIEAEWRLFMADKEVVGATEYRRGSDASPLQGAPEAILTFGHAVATRWVPAPLYVLDVCLSAGNLYVVEAQGFNSAGLYAAKLDPIVAAANRAAVIAWQKREGVARQPSN